MKFSDKLKAAMQQLSLTQAQVAGMTGIGKSSISQYLSGRNEPSEAKQRDMAAALGLDPEYFAGDTPAPVVRVEGQVPKMRVEDAAKLLGKNHDTIRKGLQQGVFPWGYAIHTSENRWSYFINAQRFAEIEGVAI